MFGRGGEEMEFLRGCGVAVNIVPGITAAAGIGAELQIPLTNRGVANSATFVTVPSLPPSIPTSPAAQLFRRTRRSAVRGGGAAESLVCRSARVTTCHARA
jgi:siroheme synthase